MTDQSKLWFYAQTKSRKHFIQQGPPKMLYEGGECTMRSAGHETREELCESQGIQPNPCKICGEIFSTSYTNKESLIEQGICFGCDFWNGFVAQKDDPHYIRVGGHHYQIGNEGAPGSSSFRGYGGRKFHIRKHSGEEIISTNLWFQGEIPESHREMLPNNAEFITETT